MTADTNAATALAASSVCALMYPNALGSPTGYSEDQHKENIAAGMMLKTGVAVTYDFYLPYSGTQFYMQYKAVNGSCEEDSPLPVPSPVSSSLSGYITVDF